MIWIDRLAIGGALLIVSTTVAAAQQPNFVQSVLACAANIVPSMDDFVSPANIIADAVIPLCSNPAAMAGLRVVDPEIYGAIMGALRPSVVAIVLQNRARARR